MTAYKRHTKPVPVATTDTNGDLVTFAACPQCWKMARGRWTPTDNMSISDHYWRILETENPPCSASDVTRIFSVLHAAA